MKIGEYVKDTILKARCPNCKLVWESPTIERLAISNVLDATVKFNSRR